MLADAGVVMLDRQMRHAVHWPVPCAGFMVVVAFACLGSWFRVLAFLRIDRKQCDGTVTEKDSGNEGIAHDWLLESTECFGKLKQVPGQDPKKICCGTIVECGNFVSSVRLVLKKILRLAEPVPECCPHHIASFMGSGSRMPIP